MASSLDRRLRKVSKQAEGLETRCRLCGGLHYILWIHPNKPLPATDLPARMMCACPKGGVPPIGNIGTIWKSILMEMEEGKEAGAMKFHKIAGGTSP